jgi:hypothetical protein
VRHCLTFLVLLAVVPGAGGALAQSKYKPPVVVCPLAAQAPVLDGRIEGGEWAGAGVLSDFILLGSQGMPTLKTHVYLLHTAAALYIGAQMDDDKPSELVANITSRDDRVFDDDALEFFVDTSGQRQGHAHLAVNSRGAQFDEYDHDVAENFEWNVVAAVTASGWSMELELPFDQGVPPSAGETWVLGVCRNAARAGEMSTWGRHERGFNEPEAFGEVRFVEPALAASIQDLGQMGLGSNLALVTLENLGATPLVVKLNAAVVGFDRRDSYFGVVKKELGPGARNQVYIPYKVQRCNPDTLTLSVSDDKGKTVWRSGAFPVALPPVSNLLDGAMHELAAAWKAWAAVTSTAAKTTLKADLDKLQGEWSFLDEQMATAAGMPLPRLEVMAGEAQRIRDRAAALRARVEAVAGPAA